MQPTIQRILDNIGKVMIGKTEIAELSLVALLSEGHVLLEDVPGVGKTMMVRALAKSVGAEFKRIQFTPDLLPSDVTGVSIYNPQAMEFQYRPGPIMGNIVLADEINRTSPKTQSALLEGMEERSVTVDGVTRKLARPFFVMATQNPIEYEGTYPLPEAQLDRFLFKLHMGYPTIEGEIEMLNRMENSTPIEALQPVITKAECTDLQQEAKQVYVDQSLKAYIVKLADLSRSHPSIYLGVSPRASLALMRASQSYAFLRGRDYVIPDDIQYLAPYVFAHRLILSNEAKYSRQTPHELVKELLSVIEVPVQRAAK
ncbi:AAA family ATPase [Heyndrickxia acidiproducens]|uniref:AAA family ATPase n=1 Tax=Heyndrickxia acidiproducens TaxID=1121084 RepID=UPI00037264DF|nr:MoxR family ATPase [Heyndrickxia acidiproducens]